MIQSTPPDKKMLHVLLCREQGVYLAQCLEYDIAAHGETAEQAKQAFSHAIIRHVLSARQFKTDLFEGIPQAPARYLQLWQSRVDSGAAIEQLEIPRFAIKDRQETDTFIAPRMAELILA